MHGASKEGRKLNWLLVAAQPLVVALAQLFVVTVALEIARRAKLSAAAAEAELARLRGGLDKP
jgi:hypothetical protein